MPDTSPEWKAAVARMMGQQTFALPAAPPQNQAWTQPIQSAYDLIRALQLPPMPVQARGTNIPYWMVPQPAAPAAPVTNAPTNPADAGFADAEAQSLREENIARQLGDFSKRVLSNKYLMGGE